MKHNLGKVIFLLALSLGLLHAEDFSYTFKVDKTDPYVKEPVILTLELNQTNPDMVLLFSFDLVQSDTYRFQRLDSKVTDIHPTPGLHNAKVKYVYLIYPLQPGKIDLEFKLIKKVTNDESVAYSYSGDRDNVKTLVTKDTLVTLPSLILHAKALPKKTQLVGDFTLEHTLKNKRAKAYEPIAFEIRIKGKGFPPVIDDFFEDVNITLFKEKPLVKSIATSEGTHNTIRYPMALSHHKDFTLPKIEIPVFNPYTQESYTLNVPSQYFSIKDVNRSMLVDKIDDPKPFESDWSTLTAFFTYLLVFAAGFVSALLLKWQRKSKEVVISTLQKKIESTPDAKTLLQLLMAHDSHHFADIIKVLEDSLYGNGKINLSKVKKEAIDLL